MKNLFSLEGRTALVTGGSRGIGRMMAHGLLAWGARVYISSRKASACEETASALSAHGTCIPLPADSSTMEGIHDLAKEYAAREPKLDILINNAGGSPRALAADASPRFVEAIVNLNLLAPLWCAQSAHKVMSVQEDGGSIVNVSSISGMRPSPGTSAYGAAKAGLINLTATLAVEWAPAVRVNCVTAGLLDSGAGDDFYGGPEGMERAAATVPVGRMGTPADVAEACLYLSSDAASYVTGANLVVHGGGEPPPFLAAVAGS